MTFPGRSSRINPAADGLLSVAAGALCLTNERDLRRASGSAWKPRALVSCTNDQHELSARRRGPRFRPWCHDGPRAAEGHRIDGVDHLPLHDLALVDREVRHPYLPYVDILELTMELRGLRNGFAVSVGNVEVDVAPNVSCQAGAEDRIQADRQLDGGAKAIQARHHIGQRRRTRGVPDQNDGPGSSAPVFSRRFVRE